MWFFLSLVFIHRKCLQKDYLIRVYAMYGFAYKESFHCFRHRNTNVPKSGRGERSRKRIYFITFRNYFEHTNTYFRVWNTLAQYLSATPDYSVRHMSLICFSFANLFCVFFCCFIRLRGKCVRLLFDTSHDIKITLYMYRWREREKRRNTTRIQNYPLTCALLFEQCFRFVRFLFLSFICLVVGEWMCACVCELSEVADSCRLWSNHCKMRPTAI